MVLLLALLVLVGVLLGLPELEDLHKKVLSDALFVALPACGIPGCVRAARRTAGRTRRVWTCVALTLSCWAIGNVLWFRDQFLVERQPFPSLADAFYLLALVSAASGLAIVGFTRTVSSRWRLRPAVDAAILTLSVSLVAYVTVIRHGLEKADWSLGTGILLTYPVADVLLATCALLLISRMPPASRSELLLVAAGLGIYCLSDLVYAYRSVEGTFAVGSPIDLGWMAGYVAVGLAGRRAAASPRQIESFPVIATQDSLFGTSLVYGGMVLAVVTALVVPGSDATELGLAVAVVLLVWARLSVLAGDEQQIRRRLERMVSTRTADLEELSRRHQRILDAAGEGICGLDLDGRITFVNPMGARLLGRPAGELIGVSLETFHRTHASSAQGVPTQRPACQFLEGLRRGVAVEQQQCVLIGPADTEFPAQVSVAPKLDHDERVVGSVVVFQDITERMVVERLRDDFIAMASHELRTPLTGIRMAIGLAADQHGDNLPQHVSRLLKMAVSHADRLSRLINDMLALERLESGAVPLEWGDHPAHEVIEETLGLTQPLGEEVGVPVTAGSIEGTMHGDADRVIQALTNLVTNAVKFSEPGGTVEVSARTEAGMVRFEVRDEGRGIPLEKLGLIFDRFQQVDPADARDKGGSGLGLAITKLIVTRHGGKIEAQSTPGRGSIFTFTVPAVSRVEPTATLPSDGLSAVREELSRGTVLLCDDEPDVAFVVSGMLRNLGYATESVLRGGEAVSLATVGAPDVILLDLCMPNVTGWDVIEKLREDPATRDIPIVIMSALSPDEAPSLPGRVDGWLTKPVDPPRLAEVVYKAVKNRRRPRSVLVVERDARSSSLLETRMPGD